MADFRFRSPFLKKLPEAMGGLSGQVLAQRFGTTVTVFGGLALLILAINQRWFALDGMFSWVYMLHDAVYLPIRGYTVTLFYPYSMLWLALLVVLVAMGLVSYLGLRASWRAPHVWFTRVMLENTGVHSWLLGVAKGLKKQGADLSAMALTCEDLWLRTLDSCRNPERATGELWPFRQAVAVARFALELEQLRFDVSPAEGGSQQSAAPSARLLNLWLETYLEMERGIQGSSHRQYFSEMMDRMARHVGSLLPNVEAVPEDARPFDETYVASDVKCLLMVMHPRLAQDSKRFAKLAAEKRAQVLLQRVALHHEQRLQLLARQMREWETSAFHLGNETSSVKLPRDYAEEQRGCLATWCAFLLSAVSGKLYIAESWVDNLDMLSLYQGQKPLAGVPIMEELPSLAQFQLLERMQQFQQERSHKVWKKTPFRELVSPAHEAMLTPQLTVHHLASRPDGEA